jgi:hypothetical protein
MVKCSKCNYVMLTMKWMADVYQCHAQDHQWTPWLCKAVELFERIKRLGCTHLDTNLSWKLPRGVLWTSGELNIQSNEPLTKSEQDGEKEFISGHELDWWHNDNTDLAKCNFLQVTPAKILHSLQCADLKTHSCAAAKNRQELSGI